MSVSGGEEGTCDEAEPSVRRFAREEGVTTPGWGTFCELPTLLLAPRRALEGFPLYSSANDGAGRRWSGEIWFRMRSRLKVFLLSEFSDELLSVSGFLELPTSE